MLSIIKWHLSAENLPENFVTSMSQIGVKEESIHVRKGGKNMTLDEEFKELSGKNIDGIIFDLTCTINTLKKIKLGFTIKELNEERKAEAIKTLEFLADWLGDDF